MSSTKDKVILSNDPLIFTIDNFLSDLECDHFIKLSTGKFEKSKVNSNDGPTLGVGRTSSGCWIKHNETSITEKIGLRIAKLVNMPLENAEQYQIIHYGLNEEYWRHYDSWKHDNSQTTLIPMKYGGARVLTALVYLNDVEEGGGTNMSKLNITVMPKKGRICVFENVYKGTNIRHELSEHAGMPIIKGEKYAFNLWFKECNRNMLYSKFNPKYYESPSSLIKELPTK